MERFGVENPSKNIDVHKKKLRSSKKYTLPNGVIIDLQGYEPFFLDDVKKFMKIDESIVDIPTLNYFNQDVTKVYFPDFYLRDYNLLVEVKSEYTLQQDKEMIIDKIIGAVCAGFSVLLVVYTDKGELVSSMYFNEVILGIMGEVGYDDMFIKCGNAISQYVSNGVSFNFQHGLFTNDKVVGNTFNAEYMGDIRSVYSNAYLFMHDVVNERGLVLEKYIRDKIKVVSPIYARKCEVKVVNTKEASTFMNLYHLQGKSTGGIHYGLYHGDELCSVMTFCKPRLGIGKKRENTYELSRFCSNGRITGGASKLLGAFKKNHPDMDVISYSDNSYSDGSLYSTLGFTLESDVRPRYKYIKVGDTQMLPRFKFSKYKLTEMGCYHELLSEKDIMELEGYVRVYDCGKKTWVLPA